MGDSKPGVSFQRFNYFLCIKNFMTETANQVLIAFDALSPDDRREVAAALLRRVIDTAPLEVSDEALLAVAEGMFLELDAAESQDDTAES